jgi:hypothetical protein
MKEQVAGNFIPDWMLERYQLEELTPEQKLRVEQRLSEDPVLQQRLADFARSNQEILARYPVEKTVEQILVKFQIAGQAARQTVRQTVRQSGSEQKGRSDSPRYRLTLPWSLALPVAAIFLFFLFLFPFFSKTERGIINLNETSDTRIKGLQSGLHVYMKKGSQAIMLNNGHKVRARDVLQLGYLAAEDFYCVILSLDGKGVVTLHLPVDDKQDATAPAPFIKKQAQELVVPFSYELDDAPAFERFLMVTSPKEFKVNHVLDAARKLAALGRQTASHQVLPLATDFKQYSLLLVKEEE